MIEITVKGDKQVAAMLADVPKQAGRAAEQALDRTAYAIRKDEKDEMRKVFVSPVPYTINSLKVTPTRGHNMVAIVGFKEPERMAQHYLIPQVEGGKRKLKGFERGVDMGEMVPGQSVKLDRYGNVPVRTLKAALEGMRKDSRAYVVIKHHKTLPPGLYQRFKTGKGFGKGLRKAPLQRGQSRGRYTSAVLARGLKPILLRGKQGDAVLPRLDFYGVAHATFKRVFMPIFWTHLDRQLSR
ncbi:MAG: hypothetical protein RBS40_13340 [Rhodocyclaceae bacterium]|jgi:hypothetical protein|nr:hypothetical protein [Rhodocyclaceae bacterium]